MSLVAGVQRGSMGGLGDNRSPTMAESWLCLGLRLPPKTVVKQTAQERPFGVRRVIAGSFRLPVRAQNPGDARDRGPEW